MLPTISRRVFVVGAAALPFLRIAKADARTPGILTFGLSSYPPSIQPWANTGTAAGTVKLMIHRGLLSYDTKGALNSPRPGRAMAQLPGYSSCAMPYFTTAKPSPVLM